MSEYYENPAPPYREMKKTACFLIIKLKMSVHPSLFIPYSGFWGLKAIQGVIENG